MTQSAPKKVLFTGYAPVHFLCFLPIYQQLARDERVELWLSGGFKEEREDQVHFRIDGFYDPFPVDRERVIPFELAREQAFDVLVCSHLSDTLFPRSVGRTVQIFHGVSFKNLAVREKALRFDYLCLPGRYHAELYLKQGLVRAGGSKCLLTGFPKADPLVGEAADRQDVLRAVGVDPALPTLLFAPTGDKHNSLETMGEEVIAAIAANPGWNLLIKPHDHPKKKIDWFERLARFESERVRLVRDLNVIPYLRHADLLVTDASSVAVEYTLVDRPIVFLDVPKLFRKLEERAPALDLGSYGRRIGVVATNAAEAVTAIAEGLAQPARESELRRRMARHVFHRPGGAVGRVAGVITHAAGLSPALPDGVEVVMPDGNQAQAEQTASPLP